MSIAQLDAPSAEHLRTVVGKKWSTYPDCIGAWVAEMDFGTAPPIKEELRRIVDDGFFGYTNDDHIAMMRESVAGWYAKEYGWQLPPERIHPLPDVVSGLIAAIRHFTPDGASVIVPTPAYMPFLMIPNILGREQVEVPMSADSGAWEFDYQAIDEALAGNPRGSLLILCNPCNPIGRVFRREELERIAAIVDKHGGKVFSDEIHCPLTFPGHRHIPYASISDVAAGHTVTAVSASKAWNLPGLKCAQIIMSNDADAAHWNDVGVMAGFGASSIGIVANAVAFRDGKPWLNDVMRHLELNRDRLGALLAERLPEVRYIPPEGTYLAWLDFSAYDLPCDLATFFCDEAKVSIVNGTSCGQSGNCCIRFNFAMSRDNLERAIDQMANAIARHKDSVRGAA